MIYPHTHSCKSSLPRLVGKLVSVRISSSQYHLVKPVYVYGIDKSYAAHVCTFVLLPFLNGLDFEMFQWLLKWLLLASALGQR